MLVLTTETTVDILRTFCDGFMVQCVNLMLSKFLHLCVSSFDCFVYGHNVTYLKRFTITQATWKT